MSNMENCDGKLKGKGERGVGGEEKVKVDIFWLNMTSLAKIKS